MTTSIKPAERIPRVVRPLLRVAAGLALLYFAWMIFDLVTHPFSPGNNPGTVPYLFRWLSAACGTYTVVVAVFILRRLPGNTIGFLLLLFGVGAAGWSLRTDFGSPEVTGLVQIGYGVYFLCVAFPALDALIFHFPTGQAFPPRLSSWIWKLLLFSGLTGLLLVLAPGLSSYIQVATIIIMVLVPFLALISLVLRYRVAGRAERMQIKWLVWLAGLAVAVSIGMSFFPASASSEAAWIAKITGFLFWQAFPAVGIGIALLRYRLWDIDLIIRRTLLYSVLTAIFGGLYFGSVVLLRQVLAGLTGESNVAIVLSTLLVAALFEPVRRRVQAVIDRRFYRQKYDAARSLEEFSSAARREVELAHLTAELVGVVYKTVQPEQASVWIRAWEDKPMEKK